MAVKWERLLGPVLYARPDDDDHWTFDVGVLFGGVAAKPPPAEIVVAHTVKGATVTGPARAAAFGDAVYWRWRVRLRRDDSETIARYRVRATGSSYISFLGGEYSVVVPARGQLPRMLFYSCNGFSEAKYTSRAQDLYGPWKRVLREHQKSAGIMPLEIAADEVEEKWLKAPPNPNLRGGYHLMIGGGDQIYADSLQYTVKVLEELFSTSMDRRPRWKRPADFAQTLLRAYLDLYVLRWGQAEFAGALARIPGVFTWDDHEIFDGWGSYADALQTCDAYRDIFAAAATTFDAFQLGGTDRPLCADAAAPHRLQTLSFEGTDAAVDLVVLDLRNERSLAQVMSAAQWDALNTWMADWRRTAKGPRHLLLVSSIPLVHMRFSAWQEELATRQALDDDLRDQWESPVHRGERSRLIMRLLTHSSLEHTQITILSGDVHVGAHGRITSRNPNHLGASQRETFIEQLTSSGIIHPPPLPSESLAMHVLGREGDDDIDPFVSTKLLAVGKSRYLDERNWLSIDFDVTRELDSPQVHARLWAQWWGEQSGPIEPQAVIDTLGQAPARARAATAVRAARPRKSARRRRPTRARARAASK